MLSIQQAHITGAEYPFLISVDDANTKDFFAINNNSATNSVFVPVLWGHRESGYSNEAISIIGSTTTTNDMGSVPIMIFDSRIYTGLSGSSETVPSPSSVGTRPLFDWANAGNSKMRMLYNGNLGIGTTSPSYLLDVNGSGHFNSDVITSSMLNVATTGHNQIMLNSSSDYGTIQNDGSNVWSLGYSTTYSTTTGSHVLSWNTSGNVGIGTTSPGTNGSLQSGAKILDVVGASGQNAFIRVLGGAGGTKGGLIIGNNDGSGTNYGQFTFDNNYNTFTINQLYGSGYLGLGANSRTADLVILASNANVGIGTTSPASLFSVGSSSQFQVNSSGAVVAATGITSSGTINFPGLTASQLIATDGSSNLQSLSTATYPSLAELAYVKGVTSTIQSQLSAKQATVSIGALDAQAENANGLALASNVLSAQSADGSHPGMVNITTQTFAGVKTFATPIFTTNATVPLVIGGTTTTSPLKLRSTSGAGTTGADIIFQTGNNGGTEAMRILNSGFIGMGTTSPGANLEIDGSSGSDIAYIRDHSGDLQFMVGSGGTTMIGNNSAYGVDGVGVLEVDQYSESLYACYLRSNAGGGRGLRIKGGYYSDTIPLLQIEANGPSGGGYNTVSNERMVVLANGAVGIGTNMQNNPNNYLLAVNGTVGVSGAVIVENTSATWPDYVFEKGYKAMSLPDLETYVTTEKHLPGVQSQDEIKKHGTDIAKDEAAILKNVEELSLHLIELQKENEALKARVAALESK